MTFNRCSVLFRIASCGLILAAVGCQRGPAAPRLARVSGVVTYKGIPVRDGYVKFMQEGSPIVAGGFTNDMGRFTLTSYKEGDGAPVGENKVVITLVPKSEGGDDYQDQMAKAEAISDPIERRTKLTELNQRAKSARVATLKQKPRGGIPAKYSSIEKTPLTCTIEAVEENTCEFDLTD